MIAWTYLSACWDSPADPNVPAVESIEIRPGVLGNARSVALEMSGPSPIEVEYWPAGGSRLLVRSAAAADHSILLPRLKFDREYTYEVYVVRGTGRVQVAQGTFTTGALPADMASRRPVLTGSMTPGAVMIEVLPQGAGAVGAYVAVDRQGDIIWYYRGRPNGYTRADDSSFVLLDDAMKELVMVSASGAVLTRQFVGGAHHDVIAAAKGTFLFLAQVAKTINDTTWVGEAVREWDPTAGTIQEKWNAFDFLDPATDIGTRSTPADWLHANALALGPRGNVVVSLPSLNQVISIAPDFKSLEWRLGGPNATYQIVSGPTFSFQHTASEISAGRVVLFDNARDDPSGPQGSGAVEYVLDATTHQASASWNYRASPRIWAPIVGSARRLTNGNTMIGFGPPAGLLGSTGPAIVVEVTADNLEVGRLSWNQSIFIYRGTPLMSFGGEEDVMPPR